MGKEPFEHRFWLFVIIALQTYIINASPNFYPYGLQNKDSALAREDDVFITMNINFAFPFFGKLFSQVHISTNGIIFFGQGSTEYVPMPYPINGTLSTAAYWVDSDPRQGGDIFYREEFDPVILNRITNFVRNKFVQFNTFTSTWSLIVTFSNVSRYGCRRSIVFPCQNVVNHQTILTSNGIHSFVIFLYDRLEYSDAQIGFNAGDGKRFFLVPYSNTVNISRYALENSNVGTPGEWMFSISDEISAACNSLGLLEIYPKKVLYFGQQDLYISGPCIDGNITEIEVQIGSQRNICPVVENQKIKCLTPYFDSVAQIPVALNYSNVVYKGFIIPYDFGDSLVMNNSMTVLGVSSTNTVQLQWNQSLYSSDSILLRGIKQIFRRDSNENLFEEHFPISIKISNTENYILTIPSVQPVLNDQNSNPILPQVQSATETVRYLLNIERNVYEVIRQYSNQILSTDQTLCSNWFNNEKSTSEINQIKDTESRRNPCQPTVPSNFPDPLPGGFKKDDSCNPNNKRSCDFFHSGSKGCYRSTNNPNNIAVQCCYDNNNALTAGPPSGGTLDMYDSDKSTRKHFISDVLPYLYCCKFSNECEKYYEKRPSVGSDHYVPPRPVRANGDPHFVTMDGTSYDFNPVGEFIYLKTPNTTVQARMQQYVDDNNDKKQASYFSAFAIKINDVLVLQIEHTPNKFVQLKVNNELWSYESLYLELVSAVLSSTYISLNIVTGLSFQFYSLNGMIHVITALQPDLKGKVQGLIGNWDDDPSNDFMLPNGTWISTSSTPQDIHNKFGMSWSTTNETSIFSYPENLKWRDYQDPYFVPFLGEPPADSRCGNNTQCLYDLYVTGNVNVGLSNVFITKINEEQIAQYEQMNKTCDINVYILNANVIIQNSNNNTDVSYTILCKFNYNISGNSQVRCINGTLLQGFGNCVYAPPAIGFTVAISYHFISICLPVLLMLFIA